MAGWHHWLDGHEFEWTPGVGDGPGGLACCDSWGRKEADTTEQLNWTELNYSSCATCQFITNTCAKVHCLLCLALSLCLLLSFPSMTKYYSSFRKLIIDTFLSFSMRYSFYEFLPDHIYNSSLMPIIQYSSYSILCYNKSLAKFFHIWEILAYITVLLLLLFSH